MVIKTSQDSSDISSFYKATLYSFEKVSHCTHRLFSLIREEGVAWKVFFLNNYYISKLFTLGSKTTASIARKFFRSLDSKNPIELPHTSLEELKSSNRAWIRSHSLFRTEYPYSNVSNEALLDVIFSKNVDSKGVIEFSKEFVAYTQDTNLSLSLSRWEKAYEKQQLVRKSKDQPQKMELISKGLFEKVQGFKRKGDHVILLFERDTNTINDSPLSDYIKHGLDQVRPIHDKIYESVYSKVREQLQAHLNTIWKKRLFTEIQEEIRAILLGQYSSLHQESTLGHHLPNSLQRLLTSGQSPTPEESLSGLLWDLLLQNGVRDTSDQPISEEKLNQIFRKEFEMITREIETLATSTVNQFMGKAGKELEPLLQIWHNQLPQKDRGWLRIEHKSTTHCRIILYARDRESPISHLRIYGEPSPMKVYTYEIPKHLLQTRFFLELLDSKEGEGATLSSSKNIKELLSRYGCLSEESYIPSNSKVANQGLLDHIKVYHLESTESSVGSTEKTFFQMRLHAFIQYCKGIENTFNVSDQTLSQVENGISALLEGANKLYDAGQLSDEEYMGIISTGIDIEESVLEKQYSLQKEVKSSEILVPAILKEQIRKIFSSGDLSPHDVENIKSFAKGLLGNDRSEEVALLCKELFTVTDKPSAFTLPHVSLWKTVKTLCLDVKNLRKSPIAVFKVYSDVRKLLLNIKSLIALVTYIPYICLIVACCANPVTAVACLVGGAIALYLLFNVPELEPVLTFIGATLSFQKEIVTFFLTRLILWAIQIADKVLPWNEIVPLQAGRSFLQENFSNTLSFSLNDPIHPKQKNIPLELRPLQKFHPHMEIWADTDNEKDVTDISFPDLSLELHIREQNGVKRAHVKGQPGFWIADVITDRRLEGLDFAHLVLENEKGDKKICVVPRSEGRLLLQTVLKMTSSYSQKSVDILSRYLSHRMLESPDTVYYYDVIDGELVSQDFAATSYLITHYITSGEITRCQKLVEPLKKIKAKAALENPNAIVKTLEQIATIVPNSMSSNLAKVILELSSLCEEIPMESKAFPLFLRAYQNYIESKQQKGRSYLSNAQESLLARHLQEKGIEKQILSRMGKLVLATQTPLVQTLLLLGNNLMDRSFSKFFGKEDYIPTSLKNHDLQQQYLQGDKNIVTLLIGLMLNNLVKPYFFINKDMVNISKEIEANGLDIFEQLPLIISKLNIEENTVMSDYLLSGALLLAYVKCLSFSDIPITESIKKGIPLLGVIHSLVRDNAAAFSIEPTNFFKVEEKLNGIIPYLFSLFLPENLENYGSERLFPASHFRHVLQSGITTLCNYAEVRTQYKEQQWLQDKYNKTFPELQMGTDYNAVEALEQSILGTYREISKAFLQKHENPTNTRSTVDIQEESSTQNQIMNIVNWYGRGRDREESTFSYTLQSSRGREDLVKGLEKTYGLLKEKALEQEKALENFLMCPPQNLPALEGRIKQYTRDIRDNADAMDQVKEQIVQVASQQSVIEKISTFAFGYLSSLLEAPTLGKIHILNFGQIEQLVARKKVLEHELESIKSKRQQVFQNIVTACKTETALSLHEVYDYFCQGKDALIIQSLGLEDVQWKLLKEQLYLHMVLQKHLSFAESLHRMCTDATRSVEENIDLIGYQLDTLSSSVPSGKELELSVRSRLQFEKKLGRSLSPNMGDTLKQIVNGSMENFQSIYEFSTAP